MTKEQIKAEEANMTKEQIEAELAKVKAELKRLRGIGLIDSRKARILEQWESHWRSELYK